MAEGSPASGDKDVKPCAVCGSIVPPNPGLKPRVYCTSRCRDKAYRVDPSLQKGPATCAACGCSYARAVTGQRFCSRQCRVSFRTLCVGCGGVLPPAKGTKTRKFCSKVCRSRSIRPLAKRSSFCEDCKSPFDEQKLIGPPKRVCDGCARARKRSAASQKMLLSSCERCAVSFGHRSTSRPRFCSAECRWPDAKSNRPAKCKACGETYTRRKPRQQYCSAWCFARPSRSKQPRPCIRCGATFTPGPCSNAGKFCSRGCSFAARREGHPLAREKGVQRRGGRSHKARCEHYGAPYTPISRKAILEHFGWECQICGRALLRRQQRGDGGRIDGRSPTVDHIIPLSLGTASPGHTWGNVQAACLDCNVAKSNKPPDSFVPRMAASLD